MWISCSLSQSGKTLFLKLTSYYRKWLTCSEKHCIISNEETWRINMYADSFLSIGALCGVNSIIFYNNCYWLLLIVFINVDNSFLSFAELLSLLIYLYNTVIYIYYLLIISVKYWYIFVYLNFQTFLHAMYISKHTTISLIHFFIVYSLIHMCIHCLVHSLPPSPL
jgi:hypothetical protein